MKKIVSAASTAYEISPVSASNDKLKTVKANAAMYLTLAIDIAFLAAICVQGFAVSFMVAFVIALSLQIVAVVTLLPVPLLQTGIIGRNAARATAFTLATILEFSWAIYLTPFGAGAPYYILAATRTVTFITAFTATKATVFGMVLTVVGFFSAVFALCGAGPVFHSPINAVPLKYTYLEQDNGYGTGWAVTDSPELYRRNVKIPDSHDGEPVVAVIRFGGLEIRNLTLPESVRYLQIYSSSVRTITIEGDGVLFGDFLCSSLDKLRFTSPDALPGELPSAFSENSTIYFDKAMLAPAMQKFSFMRNRFAPIVGDGEGYVMLYTDCELHGSGVAEGHVDSVIYTHAGEIVTLPVPDLTDAGYDFIGWYSGRDYRTKIDTVKGGSEAKLFSKHLLRYEVKLMEEEDSEEVWNTLYYNCETPALELPAREKSGHEFFGWFNSGETAVFGGDVKTVAGGDEGDRALYPVFKKEYTVTYHLGDADYVQSLPQKYCEWSDEISLLSGGARRDGYAFMGWYLDPEYKYEVKKITPTMGRDLDVYLKFNKLYSLTYNPAGGVINPTSVDYHSESKYVYLTEPTREGYVFDGWYDGEEKITSFMPADRLSNWSVTAAWTPIKYRIAYYSEENGNYSVLGPLFTYDGKENMLDECTFFTRDGYNFAGWKINDKVYKPSVIITENFASTANTTVLAVAVWEPHSYTLRYDPNCDDATGEMSEVTIYYGKTFTTVECEFEREGYEFEGWLIRGSIYYPGYYHMAVFHNVEDGDEIVAYAVWKKVA